MVSVCVTNTEEDNQLRKECEGRKSINTIKEVQNKQLAKLWENGTTKSLLINSNLKYK